MRQLFSTGTCYLSDGTKTMEEVIRPGDSVNVVMFDPDSVLKYSTGLYSSC